MDENKNSVEPQAVFAGDTTFISDVGRPDLRASLGWTAEDLGGRLYHSLHDKLLNLPDDTLVYPAHGAGYLCGKKLSSGTVSSLGNQRRLNYVLQPTTKEEFARWVTTDQPDAPPYFTYGAILNTQERMLDRNLAEVLQPIELEQIVRPGEAYAKGHLAGSINIGLGSQYATETAGSPFNVPAGTVLRLRPESCNKMGITNCIELAGDEGGVTVHDTSARG